MSIASPIDLLLSRIDGVKQTSCDQWMARCPAHDDDNPSLSIRRSPDGAALINCFAGCGASDVVVALGLSLSDLFPDRPDINHRIKPTRITPDYRAILRAARREATIVSLYINSTDDIDRLSDEDRAIVNRALSNIIKISDRWK